MEMQWMVGAYKPMLYFKPCPASVPLHSLGLFKCTCIRTLLTLLFMKGLQLGSGEQWQPKSCMCMSHFIPTQSLLQGTLVEIEEGYRSHTRWIMPDYSQR